MTAKQLDQLRNLANELRTSFADEVNEGVEESVKSDETVSSPWNAMINWPYANHADKSLPMPPNASHDTSMRSSVQQADIRAPIQPTTTLSQMFNLQLAPGQDASNPAQNMPSLQINSDAAHAHLGSQLGGVTFDGNEGVLSNDIAMPSMDWLPVEHEQSSLQAQQPFSVHLPVDESHIVGLDNLDSWLFSILPSDPSIFDQSTAVGNVLSLPATGLTQDHVEGIQSRSPAATSSVGSMRGEEDPLSDSVLIPALMLFYERLGGVMPVFPRDWIFSRLDRDEHRSNRDFASMLLAMSALTLIQVQKSPYEGHHEDEEGEEKTSSHRRRSSAVRLMDRALKYREGSLAAQSPSLDHCFASFFIAISLFEMGQATSAWYRLRESITMAHLCQLHKLSAYKGLSKDEAERRLRAYWLLSITERACALQCGMPIALMGNPFTQMEQIRDEVGISKLQDFPQEQLRLFDSVDEHFVDCWNQDCQGKTCKYLDAEQVVLLWHRFIDGQAAAGVEKGKDVSEREDIRQGLESKTALSRKYHRQVQFADVEVTRHWLLNRLWIITLNHGLLQAGAKEPALRFDYVLVTAQTISDVCQTLSVAAMEALGVGVAYKLYHIAETLVTHCTGKSSTAASIREASVETMTEGNLANNESKSGESMVRERLFSLLSEYQVLFGKLQNGDHPYVEKLKELLKEV